MAIAIYILIGLAVVGGIAIIWIRHFTGIVERKFEDVNKQVREQDDRICVLEDEREKQDIRICTLEEEKRQQGIRYNALEGCYRALVVRFEAAIDHIKACYVAMRKGGIMPPEPPTELELDEDMKSNGHTNGLPDWKEIL